jgi:CheY-like chemotaxis protein
MTAPTRSESRSRQLVIMDVLMPGMGGIAATRVLLNRHPELVVVLVSMDDPSVHIDGMCNANPIPSGPTCRDLLSSSAALGRAGLQTMELEEAPVDNPNGTRPASSADHDGVGRYFDR